MNFRTQWNQAEIEFPPVQYESKSGYLASLTIPDQTLPIREIMNRFARGLPIDGEKVPIYHGEENDLPDMRALDLAEQQELMELNAERIKKITAEIQRQNKPVPVPETAKEEESKGEKPKESANGSNDSKNAPV